MVDDDPEHIRITEPIRPVRTGLSRASDTKESANPAALEKVISIDDEEKARQIAEQDLNHVHKQVRNRSHVAVRL